MVRLKAPDDDGDVPVAQSVLIALDKPLDVRNCRIDLDPPVRRLDEPHARLPLCLARRLRCVLVA